MATERKLKITRKEVLLISMFSFVFVFSFFLFNQIDVILSIQGSINFEVRDVIWAFILSALIGLVAIVLLLLLLAQFFKKTFKVVITLLFGFVLASYVQVLFLNGDYVSELNADTHVPWSTGMRVFATIAWIAALLIPLAFVYAHKIPKIKRIFKRDIFQRVILFGSAIIFVMQAIGLVGASVNADNKIRGNHFYFSLTQQLNLGTDENIIVFMIDRWAMWQSDQVFYNHPHAKDFFRGFTFYRNNLSEYLQTSPSVVTMLTGKSFTEEIVLEKGVTEYSSSSFTRKAWEQATLFDALEYRNFTRNVLLDAVTTFIDINDIEDYFDNIVPVDDDQIRINSVQAVYAMSGFMWRRILPYPLKRLVHNEYQHRIHDVVSIATGSEAYFPNRIRPASDRRFIERVASAGLNATNENVFSFIHLNGTHNGARSFYDAVGVIYNIFNMLDQYFAEMDRLGIFDDATIILMADHGQRPHHITNTPNIHEERTISSFVTSLFIKERGTSRSLPMEVDSVTPLSNRNFLPTIFYLINKPHQQYGYSFFDIIHDGKRPTRHISLTTWRPERIIFHNRFQIANDWIPATPWPF